MDRTDLKPSRCDTDVPIQEVCDAEVFRDALRSRWHARIPKEAAAACTAVRVDVAIVVARVVAARVEIHPALPPPYNCRVLIAF
jgi:hypothetical protein